MGVKRVYLTHEDFERKVREYNPNIKLIGKYKGGNKHILAEDQFGIINVIAHTLLKSIPTINVALNKTEYWINTVKHLHNLKYDYSKVKYVSSSKKVTIICPIHGEFDQIALSHTQGHGCACCAREEGNHGLGLYSPKRAERHKEKWITIPAHVYYITLFTDKEVFNKVGITTSEVSRRFKNLKGYKLKTSELVFTNLYEAIGIERDVLKCVKKYRYLPEIRFEGYTECFKFDVSLKRFQKRRSSLRKYELESIVYKEKLTKFESEVSEIKSWIHKLEADIQECKDSMTEKVNEIKELQRKIFGAEEAIVALTEIID